MVSNWNLSMKIITQLSALETARVMYNDDENTWKKYFISYDDVIRSGEFNCHEIGTTRDIRRYVSTSLTSKILTMFIEEVIFLSPFADANISTRRLRGRERRRGCLAICHLQRSAQTVAGNRRETRGESKREREKRAEK